MTLKAFSVPVILMGALSLLGIKPHPTVKPATKSPTPTVRRTVTPKPTLKATPKPKSTTIPKPAVKSTVKSTPKPSATPTATPPAGFPIVPPGTPYLP